MSNTSFLTFICYLGQAVHTVWGVGSILAFLLSVRWCFDFPFLSIELECETGAASICSNLAVLLDVSENCDLVVVKYSMSILE